MQNKNEIKFQLVKPLPHELFDEDALKVYYRLRRNRFSTYFVGGCIRDLLLGNPPKDFDIVTSARPKQIRRLFHNSRIIGRRFRLVNVFFGKKVIEVTTFRKTPWENGEPDNQKKLLIQNDNFFGSDEEDAMRRDFTINALFYCPEERMVVDYTDGLEDLQYGKVRTIGDPKIRLAEDPVRIIRAIKFAACLGFEMTPDLYQAVLQCSHFLERTPPARILLEMLKVLRTRKVYFCFDSLLKSGALAIISPDLAKILHQSRTEEYRLLHRYFRALDALADSDRTKLMDETLFTIPCWSIFIHKNQKDRKMSYDFFETVLEDTKHKLSLSKRLRQSVFNIINLQMIFDRKNKKKISHSLVSDIPAAIQVLKIRMLMGDVSEKSYQHWLEKTEKYFSE
ncbi:polynucleotide adenylyltransferase PcnB [Candidatus Uabimicrobium sp. HlEnr_7]|uniref:polynucleotide adenylyltransferase PcnB n=1 Tax=Candidatus Uabimicrobium helgolandensis TaxID=3095367 RepID=UPI003557DFD2